MKFAFYGRVSTEDQQDPEASRNWQISRARSLIGPVDGEIVAEFFDVGKTRTLPWKRRPQSATLLDALKQPDRGFDAVVIGEPQRAFYGNQFGLTFPLFVHYGVQLWVPEVGGAIDPGSDAHDLVMALYGGMSKGERNRIKIRVRSAMAAQTASEGRFLGGRPPYGYRLADAGPHPHPAKAAEGRRLHKLEPDPDAAPTVKRIFREYLAGKGIYAIAEGLTRDGIPSPSAHDPARNPHRSGVAWSKSAVRAILGNPRYTGRQVWNRQRKDEVLLDVDDVALGHETKLRWNPTDAWIWSPDVVHEPLITPEQYEQTQADLALAGKRAGTRKPHRSRHTYVLHGLVHCAACGRRMQGHWANAEAYYRCRYPAEYALANTITHPANVYLREAAALPALDAWLAQSLDPPQLATTIEAMADAQETGSIDGADDTIEGASRQTIIDCDRRLNRYRAALEAGTDPALVASWIAEVNAERSAAQNQPRQTTGRMRMTTDEINALVTNLVHLADVLRRADPADKAAVYQQLGLTMTYEHQTHTLHIESRPHVRDEDELAVYRRT